jgi:hypothetical protein
MENTVSETEKKSKFTVREAEGARPASVTIRPRVSGRTAYVYRELAKSLQISIEECIDQALTQDPGKPFVFGNYDGDTGFETVLTSSVCHLSDDDFADLASEYEAFVKANKKADKVGKSAVTAVAAEKKKEEKVEKAESEAVNPQEESEPEGDEETVEDLFGDESIDFDDLQIDENKEEKEK